MPLPSQTHRVIAVVGPTATGKTVIGARLARHLQSEVISVDSQQVYEGLSIGVARPTIEEMQDVPHHLIGVVPPITEFSAGNYIELAMPILNRLFAEAKIPVLVGGTGFYLRALLQPGHLPSVPVDEPYREALRLRIAEEGLPSVYEELQRIDPERAGDIYATDAVRIVRALEINHLTGGNVPKTPRDLAYPTQAIGLTYADRERHLRRIEHRLEHMVDAGFLAEVETLYQAYGRCYALRTAHGYSELIEVLEGKRTLENAVAQIAINIRQYSKRQMTWFRQFPGIHWYAVDEMSEDEIMTDVILKHG